LNNLYQHSSLFQDSFGATMLSIDRGQPRTLGLKPILERFIAHRRDVVTRRTRYELRRAKEREHVLLGYKIALDHIDEIIDVIKDELREVKNLFADPRRTDIQGEASDLSDEDLIAEEDMVVTFSHQGYVKRNPVSLYRAQRRGGRGKAGAGTTDEDFIEQIF